ncbi:HD domain-containing protein [Pseudomonas sp. ZL2]
MADLLRRHLEQKTKEHSALKSLYSQWDFDEKLIPKALQTVGALFPHYSRHDESHSKQILINIERVLGENIALLTATDTWLILESAYWHDIGMVVPRSDMDEALQDPKFKEFLQYYCDNSHHELHGISSALKGPDKSNLFFDHSNPADAVVKFRELMAEWFRGKHPGRADQIVRSPMQTIGVNSPRTELIPSRLFRLLGRICQMHGAPFESILADGGLPFREAGLAQEDCHPRFVACLLRMGDLLDMDDNRFCPVMQRVSGDDRPKVSKAHEDKHSGIRHLRIDQEKIEVDAECDSIDGYIEAFKWFEWLKQETQNQMANWRDIVPNRELGLLPTLGKISVKIGGNIQILRDGEKPAFGIDLYAAIELLQGHNLYDSKFDCIREIIQNAVDATLLRVWLEHGRKADIDWSSPDSAEIKELFSRYPVGFELTESLQDADALNEIRQTSWKVTITDSGTGISKNDLEHMLKVGGSRRNTLKQQQIASMPEWMKPSGTFGIGLQSLFMISDSLHIETKSLISNEAFSITMHSPTGPKDGLVILHRMDSDFSKPFGSKLTAMIKLDTFSRSFSTQHDDDSISAEIVNNLDPILHESFPYEAAQVYDAAVRFSENSLIPIKGKLASGIINHSNSDFDCLHLDSSENPWHFVRWNGLECRLQYKPSPHVHPSRACRTFYRGQEFETKGLNFPNVIVAIDILSGSASKWLRFSRDKAFKTAMKEIEEAILGCLSVQVRLDLNSYKVNQVEDAASKQSKSEFSFFLKSMALRFDGDWDELAKSLGDSWLDLEIKNQKHCYRYYFNLPEWTAQVKHDEKIVRSDESLLVISGVNSELTLWVLISDWLSVAGNSVSVAGGDNIYDLEAYESYLAQQAESGAQKDFFLRNSEEYFNAISFKRIAQEPWNDSAFATALYRATRSSWGNERLYVSTKLLSCDPSAIKRLAIADSVGIRARNLFHVSPYNSERVVLPFLFRGRKNKFGRLTDSDDLEALCHWVQPKLIERLDISEIRNIYVEFIGFLDNELMPGTVYYVEWCKARGIEPKTS